MRVTLLLASAVSLAACGAEVPRQQPAQPPGNATVTARGETTPVGTTEQDAADDAAIWRNAADPAASLIVATDKKAGLHVYGLDGKQRHFAPAGLVNNVDLIDPGDGRVLVVASNRDDLGNARLQLYRLDTTSGGLTGLGSVSGGRGEAYGVCLWRDGDSLYAFSVLKEGRVHQVRLDLDGRAPAGRIVRSIALRSQPEGCVVDPASGQLYVGEEAVGVWRFGAAETAPTTGELVARVDRKTLVADVEGLAVVARPDGGYLIVSSQGDNAYVLYRLPGMIPAGRFRVIKGNVGSTEETDGIAVELGDFGPAFPGGLLVVQDGDNAPFAQNFKLVAWDDVVRALKLGR